VSSKALFISFEGGEGVGKSTQVRMLQDNLIKHNISALLTREPGGSAGAETIRELLVTGEPDKWSPITEVLLFNAARADHLEKTVKPALKQGKWVISDRYADSLFAYQGMGQGVSEKDLLNIHKFATGDFWPDITFILDAFALDRAISRETDIESSEDRFEKMSSDFHLGLQKSFLEIAKNNPDRCHVINASGTIDEVAGRIWQVILDKNILPRESRT
jgi:dTMP kinase